MAWDKGTLNPNPEVVNAKGFGSQLQRVDTDAFEAPQTGVEYYSPDQSNLNGPVYRQYVSGTCPVLTNVGYPGSNAAVLLTETDAVAIAGSDIVISNAAGESTIPENTIRTAQSWVGTVFLVTPGKDFSLNWGQSYDVGPSSYSGWIQYLKEPPV